MAASEVPAASNSAAAAEPPSQDDAGAEVRVVSDSELALGCAPQPPTPLAACRPAPPRLPPPASPQQQQNKQQPGKKKAYKRIELPTPEQMASEEFMNNCAVRTALSGAMGSVLGVAFGVFMGTMDGAGGVSGRRLRARAPPHALPPGPAGQTTSAVTLPPPPTPTRRAWGWSRCLT